ncbi:MAG: uroporphyrinogen decarboxylase, partial [Deltaproteobacteria bacterium]|nr:uroporphyrinogen decarboxylase [Deltaproteobacteria bacterium]
MGSFEESYIAREKRFNDAVALGRPDRVPILSLLDFYPARCRGITVQTAMYDAETMRAAWTEAVQELEPDLCENPFPMRFLGRILEALDYRQLRWAGHGLEADASYQFVETEYMKAEEYDAFLHDPTDFLVRVYWPRVCGALAPLAKLPPMHAVISYYLGLGGLAALADPGLASAWTALRTAADEIVRMAGHARSFAEELKGLGFPMLAGSATQVPFDTLGDFFRGTRGSMTDLFRRPEKVLAANEKLLPMMVRLGIEGAKRTGVPRVFIPLHRGLDGFLSDEQFARFYWPGMKELLLALIAEGLTPLVFVEGDFTSRLKYLADVPPGKVCYHFERTPIETAKAALRERACVRGGVPLSLLATGTPGEVRALCRRLIETVGEG